MKFTWKEVTLEDMKEDIPQYLTALSDKAIEAVWLYINGLYTQAELFADLSEVEIAVVNNTLEIFPKKEE